MVQLKAIHRKPRSNVLGRDVNQAWCFEHCFWEHQRKLFSGRGYDPCDQDAVSRPMGSLIEKPFNLSMKKMLIRFRNLTPARDVPMKGHFQYHFLGMGRPNQDSWKAQSIWVSSYSREMRIQGLVWLTIESTDSATQMEERDLYEFWGAMQVGRSWEFSKESS